MDDATSSTYRYVDMNSLPFLPQLPPPSPTRHPAPPLPPVARPPSSINHNMSQAYNAVLGISHTNTHTHAFTPPRRISPPQHHRPSIEASYGHSKNAPHYHVQPRQTHKTPPLPPSLSLTPPAAAFTSRQLPPLPDMAPNQFAPSSPRAHATGMPQRTNSLPAVYSHPSSSQPQASLPYSSPPHLMIRSYSDPFISSMATAPSIKSSGSGGTRFLPPFSKAFNATTIPATTAGTTEDWQPTHPITTRFTGTEVPAHEVALNVPAIVATRHERVKKQSTTKQLAALQRAAERRKLEAHLAHIQSQNQSQGQSQDQGQAQTQTGGWLSTSTQHGHPSASLMQPNHHDHQQEQQASTSTGTGNSTTSASSSKAATAGSDATAAASTPSSSSPPDFFPHQRHTKGRFASAPPPFDKDREPAYMRPRLQDEKFPGDLYTPAIVRAGKSCGIKGSGSGSVGSMGSKEAWCGLCLPHQVRSSTSSGAVAVRGSSLLGGWLNLRNSSYRYHMIRAHGISPKTCRPYAEPLETQRRQAGVDGKVGEGTELKGHCHQCRKWVVFGATEPTNWWVHASKCHQEILPDAEEVKGAMVKNESAASSGGSNSLASITPFGPLAEVGGLGATNLFASPSSSTRASSSGSSKVSPKKRPRTTTTTTTSSSTSAHHHYAHSRPVLGQFTTLSHNTRPGSSTSTTTTTSSSRKRRAPPSFVSDDDYNYHDDGELDEDDDEEEAEAAKGYSAKVGGGVGGGGVVETEGPEPGWTISSSGRIIRLRDARWGNAV